MRAAIMTGPKQPLALREVARPSLNPGQVLVALESCGVCHTDLHVWSGSAVATDQPEGLILGHEGIGRIVELGAGVAHLKIGTRIGVPWIHDTCGHCRECLGGAESFCQAHRAHGFNVHGAFAEYVAVDARFAVPLGPDSDPLSSAPLMCAGVTAYGAIGKARLAPGMVCAVFGCGGLGQYAIQLAQRAGASVIALDVSAEKLARARELGAAHAVMMNDQTPDVLRTLGGADACINFAPTPKTWEAMLAGIRPRGRIVAAAMVSNPVPLNQEWLTASGVEITGTSVGTRLQMQELLQIHAERPLLAEISPIALADINAGMTALSKGEVAGRLVIDFTRH